MLVRKMRDMKGEKVRGNVVILTNRLHEERKNKQRPKYAGGKKNQTWVRGKPRVQRGMDLWDRRRQINGEKGV